MTKLGDTQAGVTAALLGISLLSLLARCYVRTLLTKSFGYDDVLAIILWTMYACFSAFVFVAVAHGLGQHMLLLTIEEFSKAMKAYYFSELFYCAASTMVKIAVGTLYMRIATKRTHIWTIWGVMIFASVFGVVLFFQILFQCAPIDFFWSTTRNPLQGHCVTTETELAFTYTHAAVSALGDFIFGILPIFFIKGIQMNKRTKVLVCTLLVIANLASVATIIRIHAIYQIGNSGDFLYSSVDLAIWSSVEIGVATTCSNLSTLRPLFRSILSSGDTAKYGYQSSSNPSAGSRAYGGYVRSASPREYNMDELKRSPISTLPAISSGDSTERIVPPPKTFPKDGQLNA